MTPSDNFSLEDGFACFRPVGEFTLEAVTRSIDEAIACCVENGIRNLLVDLRDVTGFPPPGLAERFYFISQWAATSGGRLRLSIVAQPEMVATDKFGVVVAANRGMTSNAFADRTEAVAWLKKPYSPPVGGS